MKYFTCFILLVSTASLPSQGTLEVRFEAPQSDRVVRVGEYFESGMWFRPIHPNETFTIARPGPDGGFPDNGTAFVWTDTNPEVHPQSLMFGLSNGSSFGLVSIDLAEEGTASHFPTTIQFECYRFDGSLVSMSFTTDGIIDGSLPEVDFQTFYFGPEFASGLTRVEVPGYGWSLDNLVISIPEPATGALFVAGAIAGALRGRKRA